MRKYRYSLIEAINCKKITATKSEAINLTKPVKIKNNISISNGENIAILC